MSKEYAMKTTERSSFLHYHMSSESHNVGDEFFTCHMVVCIADLLKHDKVLSKRQPLPHLKSVPEYMRDPSTEAASKALKLARAAMGQISGVKRKRRGSMYSRRTCITYITTITGLWVLITSSA